MITKSMLLLPIAGSDLVSKRLSFLQDTLKNKFKNILFFAPISNEDGLNSCFTKEKALTLYSKGQKDQILKTIIAKFEQLKQECDFIIIIGSKKISPMDKISLNCEIAKNLSVGIIADCKDEKDAKIFNIMCTQHNAVNFASIIDEKIFFENDKECFSMSDIENKSEIFIKKLENFNCNITTPLKFEVLLYQKAASNKKIVVLPEGDDDRILKAADILNKSKAVSLILLGEKDEINKNASKLNLDLSGIEIIAPQNSKYIDEFANILYELRKPKGMELEKAKELVQDRTYFATMLVHTSKADAMVSGASTTTADTIRPALQIIKTKPGVSIISSSFLMCLDTQMYVFADCAINPNPTSEQLAMIALSTAQTAKAFGIAPKIAMLSYSTGDSGSGHDVNFVVQATNKARELDSTLAVDGPLQFDAAVDEIVAKKKLPNSSVAGKANVFVFPNLNCGNICYKAVQRTAGAVAIGPILQGIKKPINDLSRGCLVEDIVNTVLISAIQAGEDK